MVHWKVYIDTRCIHVSLFINRDFALIERLPEFQWTLRRFVFKQFAE
jgi:hypothetical protein